MDEKHLDKLLKENLTTILDSPVDVDLDKCWKEFEQKLQAEEKSKNKSKNTKLIMATAALIALTLLTVPALFPEQVTAFKNNIFRTIHYEDGQRIITDKVNPEIIEGEYHNLTFVEAQTLTVQHLLYPEYLPGGFQDIIPQIDVIINNAPHSLTIISFKKADDDFIVLVQESRIGEGEKRTYVPENIEMEIVHLLNDEQEFLLFKASDTVYRINWLSDSMEYTLTTSQIDLDDIILYEAVFNISLAIFNLFSILS